MSEVSAGDEFDPRLEEYLDTLAPEEMKGVIFAQGAIIRAYQKRQGEVLESGETDDLTNILNRRGLRRKYEESRSGGGQHRRSGELSKPDLVGIIDLDKFKEINDAFGHNAGNRTLQQIAMILGLSIRRDDELGRLGGDEFMLILHSATIEEGKLIVNKIRAKAVEVREAAPSIIVPEFSIGLAEIDYSRDFDDMYRDADMAMYHAKRESKEQA